MPWTLIFYALPNGNTIEQTVGRTVREGMDWHFGIQHIGAQVRLLRHLDTTRNYAVAYLEASPKSWPAWRQAHADGSRLIRGIVDSVRRMAAPVGSDFVLSAHSGGGSFLFGYLSDTLAYPAELQRVVFLDADYGFDPHAPTAARLRTWLTDDTSHALVVVAYDDRNIELNGKRVVGPDGGTYRRTFDMADFFTNSGCDLRRSEDSLFIRWDCARPDIALRVQKNPKNEILHTVLVERNGFLFGIGAFHDVPGIPALWSEPAYGKYVQP